MCSIEVSVSEFSPADGLRYAGSSASEAFKDLAETYKKHLDQEYPFFIFAKDTEKVLLEAARNNVCSREASTSPISVEIIFYTLDMIASEDEVAKIRTELTGVKSSYADVMVDRANRTIKAKIIWNPRRMLRDQLVFVGYIFDEPLPLLPFVRSEYIEAIGLFSDQVVYSGAWGRATELKGAMSDDLYGLLLNSGRTTRVPWGGLVSVTADRLIKASRPGYTALTRTAIERAFESGSPEPLISVLDIQNSDIHGLFNLRDWASGPGVNASWARVSDDVHTRLEAGKRRLRPQDWNSGPNWWLIDIAVPARAIPTVMAELQKHVFKDEQVRTLMQLPRKDGLGMV